MRATCCAKCSGASRVGLLLVSVVLLERRASSSSNLFEDARHLHSWSYQLWAANATSAHQTLPLVVGLGELVRSALCRAAPDADRR